MSVINMAWIASVVSIAASFFVTPFLMFMLCIIFLASIGKSLGVRRLYVKILLMIFEYGRAEVAQKRSRAIIDDRPCSEEDDDDDENDCDDDTANSTAEVCTKNVMTESQEKKPNSKQANGVVPHMNGNTLISRDKLILVPDPSLNVNSIQNNQTNKKEASPQKEDGENEETTEIPLVIEKDFPLTSCLDYVKAGVEAIIEDQVTSRFEAEELKNWNLLTRTNRFYEFISWRLTVIWMCGFVIRYFFLFPLRVLICFIGVIWIVFATFIIGFVPESRFKRWLNERAFIMTFRILARSLSVVLTFHNRQYQPNAAGVCVANHTTPIDVVILSTESSFSLIGQRHGGFLGILQRALARASPHIWFERSEVKDRHAVANRLKKHVSNSKNPPILIFPEGTCINNTSVMQFKKGSFEVGSVIYPVAIKYDPKFGDAFWNSSKYSMMQYLYMMMTSWAIVCEVWYLPPMYQDEGESAIDFANRVKGVIAKQGGLVDLMWDGQLKRMKPKKEWKERQQEEFSKLLKVD